ncbi:EF-hand domain-containing family member B [Halyomorpha halys]|uniref:EF-hand domain-containing family member B n=1 Tax=Halyomorpha halys TaxID=286706 RepID=UPI0006D4E63A|nr:EF-hand domain-containing family member B [Halyomorpha halys]
MADKRAMETKKNSVQSSKIIGRSQKESVSELLKYVSLEDEVEAVTSTLPKPSGKKYPNPHSTNANLNTGFHTQVQKLLSPPKKRVFQHLREELGETAYKSYWTTELGKAPDQVPNLPVGMNPETTVFGRPSKTIDELTNTVSDVVFPKKPYGEVELEYELGLNLYRRTHNHYLPGQKRDHHYDAPESLVFGKMGEYNKTGTGAKKCLQWFVQSNVSRTSKRLAKFKERTYAPFGQVLSPNKNILVVGLDHTFGTKTKTDQSGARNAMRFVPLNNGKYAMGEFISYISALRNKLKKRVPPFPFFELLANFKLLDQGGCSCLPLSMVYNVCNSFGLFFDNEIYEAVLKKLGILQGENTDTVSYSAFCNLLDFTKPFPVLPKIDDIPDEYKCYQTTYQALSKDHMMLKDYQTVPAAGIPTLRTDRNKPQDGECRGETELLLDENGVDSCIRPSIFTSYGLHPRDFMELKSKDYMKDLWKRVGVTIPDELFELMWKEALTRDENNAEKDMVCIETFRNMLDEMSAAKLFEMQEG